MTKPDLWIIAGPNGAGKTTLAQCEPIRGILPAVTVLNPDDRTWELLQQAGYVSFADPLPVVLEATFIEAANQIANELDERLGNGEAVCVETVLSTDKYTDPVQRVIRAGGFVGLIYIALRTPELAVERVAIRVEQRGHGVPADRIVSRWHRSLEKLPWFAALAHRFWVFDNSDADPDCPPALLAEGGQGVVTLHDANAIPKLTSSLRSIKED